MYSCKCCAQEFKFLYWKKVRPEKSSTFSLLELFSGRTFFLDKFGKKGGNCIQPSNLK